MSDPIDRAAAREEVILARVCKPVVRLVADQKQEPQKRTPGIWKGRVDISADFDELPESIAKAFRSES
jgi:antitoxin (DNA-binding transcriptional repressor) of toxin-antitoxin stability system